MVKYDFNKGSCKAYILLSFDSIPKNCGECPLYIENEIYDYDAGWGSGYKHECPFKCDNWGCLVDKPSDCPIVVPDNKRD